MLFLLMYVISFTMGCTGVLGLRGTSIPPCFTLSPGSCSLTFWRISSKSLFTLTSWRAEEKCYNECVCRGGGDEESSECVDTQCCEPLLTLKSKACSTLLGFFSMAAHIPQHPALCIGLIPICHIPNKQASDISSHHASDMASHQARDISSHQASDISSHQASGISSHQASGTSSSSQWHGKSSVVQEECPADQWSWRRHNVIYGRTQFSDETCHVWWSWPVCLTVYMLLATLRDVAIVSTTHL